MKTRGSRGIKATIALVAATLLAGCGPGTPEEFVAAAKQELAKNDRAAAIIHLRNALQKNPDSAEARFLLGKAMLDAGDALAAEKELRKAVEFGYPADQALPALARSMLMLGQSDKLIDEFEKVDLGSPEGTADLQTTIGLALLSRGNVSAAQAGFTAALAVQADYPRALFGEARIKAGAGELEPALDLIEKALAKAPDLLEGWRLKGGILAVQKQPDAALAAFQRALEIDRRDVESHASIIAMLMGQGKLEEAGKQLEAMKKVALRHPRTQYLQARLAYEQKDYAAANEAIQQHLRSWPNNLAGMMLGATIDLQLKSYAQAEAKLIRVLNDYPRNRFATRLLITTYVESGQSTKAMAALRPILHSIEKDPDMLALAGATFMQSGDLDAGVRYFEKAAALDPESTGKRTALALAQLRKGDTDRALEELEHLAASDSGTRADMALIATYLRQRQPDKALIAIDALEKKQPGSPIASNLRGVALLVKGDKAGARRSFERALELDQAYFPAASNLARLDLLERNPDQAKKRFEAVLAKDPKSAQAYLAIAQLRAGAGGTAEEVGDLIAKAVAANPNDEGARLALIDYYLRNRNATKATTAAEEALAALTNRPQLLDALGRAQRAAGDSNQAISTYRKMADLVPGSPVPHLRIAQIQIAAKEKDKALESLRQALVIQPDFVAAQRGIIALDLDAGRLPQAVAVAREIQKQRPKQPVGYLFEGDIYASKKSWTEAIAAYRTGLKQAESVELASRLDAALRASGNQAEAEKFESSWLKDHPKDAAFRLYVAQSAVARKDFATGIGHYSALAEARPNDGQVLNNLAWAMGQANDPRALEYAEKAYKLAPNNPNVMDTLGVLLVEKGSTARGVELLRKGSDLAPKSAQIRLNLAKALIKVGQKDAAKKELEVLEKLGSTYPAQAEVARLMKTL